MIDVHTSPILKHIAIIKYAYTYIDINKDILHTFYYITVSSPTRFCGKISSNSNAFTGPTERYLSRRLRAWNRINISILIRNYEKDIHI